MTIIEINIQKISIFFPLFILKKTIVLYKKPKKQN